MHEPFLIPKNQHYFEYNNFQFHSRDKSRMSALIQCRVCSERFQTSINFLSEPVDVYNDWIDGCEATN